MSFTPTPPNQDYQPPVGQPTIDDTVTSPPSQPSSYADLGLLQSLLQQAQLMAGDIGNTLDQTLNSLALPIGSTDTTLQAAVAQTYPAALGAAPNFVSYGYYQYLGTLNSNAATLIMDAYESALQDVGGNDSIDLLPLVSIINQELGLINDFVANNLSTLNDSAEQRIVEAFQDYVSTATTHLQNIQTVFQSQTTPLSASETSLLSQADAQNSQALFKVNLNKLNTQINQDIQTLQTNFATNASNFYTYFLGPALNFRQNVTSQLLPVYPGTLGAHLTASVNATNADLQNILVDQTSRNYFFASQVTDILKAIQQRDQYRDYIIQLADQGTVPPAGSSGQVIQITDAPDATAFFNAVSSQQDMAATPSFQSDHQSLDNRTDPTSHPQYLLTRGGNLTGNLTLDPNVTIDDIIPHSHMHTGKDGSQQINGSSIAPGTLIPSSVNTTVIPDIPTAFEVIGVSINYIGGAPIATVFLAWQGDENVQFEIQSSLLS